MGRKYEPSCGPENHARWPSAATAFLLAVCLGTTLLAPSDASARALKNFVTDLFGGQGILINDPFEGVEQANLNAATLQNFGTINSSIGTSLGAGALSSAVSGSVFDTMCHSATGPDSLAMTLSPSVSSSAACSSLIGAGAGGATG